MFFCLTLLVFSFLITGSGYSCSSEGSFMYVIHKSNASMMSSAAVDDRTLLRRCIPCRTECVWRCLSHRLGSRGVHGRRLTISHNPSEGNSELWSTLGVSTITSVLLFFFFFKSTIRDQRRFNVSFRFNSASESKGSVIVKYIYHFPPKKYFHLAPL